MGIDRGAFHVVFVCLLASQLSCLAAQAPKAKEPEALKRADAAFHAGYAAQQAGNLELARARFAEAVRLAPRIPEAHQALGTVLIELGETAGAIQELKAALKLKPDDPGIETNLALAFVKANNLEQALTFFSEAFNTAGRPGREPVNAAFCEAYAHALAAAGKQAQAIDIFRAALDREPNRPDLFDDIGSLYAQLGKWDEARPEFERALAMDDSHVLPRIHLGIVLRQQHNYDAALLNLETAVNREPANALAQFEFGRTLEAAGKDDAAIPHLEEAIKLDPEIPEVQDELAMALQREGRQQEAIPWFRKAIEREPHNVSALTNLGLALTLTGKANEAQADFQQALALSPKDPVIYKDLGVAHIQLSAFDEAIEDFQKALVLDPDDSQLHYDLGMACKFKDRVNDAIAELPALGRWIRRSRIPLHFGHPLHADRAAR